MHYYKRHLGDYARDTGHLSALEHGIYTLLLDWYYVNERPIPADKAVRIARGNPEETRMVLEEYFELTDEGWRHHYADREIAEYQRRSEHNREVGKLGGRPKKTQPVSEREPERNPQETLTTNHKPLTTNQEEEKNSCASSSDDAPTRSDPIPYQSIVDAYNRTMTGLAKVRDLTTKRRTATRKVWTGRRQSPEFWTAYFAECQRDNFLNGTGPYRNGHENWRPDFDYLMREDVVVRTYERAISRMEREQ